MFDCSKYVFVSAVPVCGLNVFMLVTAGSLSSSVCNKVQNCDKDNDQPAGSG
jgi:hypothetical protein